MREFKGSKYEINIQNPNHVSKGVAALVVDGKAIEGNIIPDFKDGKLHQVEVTLG